MKMVGIIFADQYDTKIDELTEKRTLAAIPFGARYRVIDFFLSNMTNSGIRNIGVITTLKYESLMNHIRYGAEWDLNRKKSGLTVLPPFSFDKGAGGRYENLLEALQGNMLYLKESKEKYVLITCCDAIGNIDYNAMLEQHIESGARITCMCTRKPINKSDGLPTTEYVVSSKGKLQSVIIGDHAEEGAYIATNTYLMEREDLLSLLDQSIENNWTSFRKDVIKPTLSNSNIMAYETKETLLFIDNVSSYLKSNLDLLNFDLRNELFRQENRPINTRVGDSAPGFYGPDSKVTNSLVAAGTKIEGTVKNSIIFRGVHIKKGAVVENSVINQNSTVGENAVLNYAVLDKDVIINDKRNLSGYITHPFVVKDGSVI